MLRPRKVGSLDSSTSPERSLTVISYNDGGITQRGLFDEIQGAAIVRRPANVSACPPAGWRRGVSPRSAASCTACSAGAQNFLGHVMRAVVGLANHLAAQAGKDSHETQVTTPRTTSDVATVNLVFRLSGILPDRLVFLEFVVREFSG